MSRRGVAVDGHQVPKTVANYVSAIVVELQVTDRVEAMIRAREAGLGR